MTITKQEANTNLSIGTVLDIEAQCRNGTPLYTEAQMRQLASSVADVCDPEGIWADEYIELIKEMLG